MNDYIINIIFILVFFLVIKYIKKNNETIQILASRIKLTEKEEEQNEEFKRLKKISDEKEKNKIRY